MNAYQTGYCIYLNYNKINQTYGHFSNRQRLPNVTLLNPQTGLSLGQFMHSTESYEHTTQWRKPEHKTNILNQNKEMLIKCKIICY